MQRDILLSVAAGLLSAILYLSAKWGFPVAPFFALFTPLPLFAAGLGLGLIAGGGTALIATIIVALVADLTVTREFSINYVVPVLLVVHFALLNRTAEDGTTEWYPLGMLLAWITLFGIGTFTVLANFTGGGSEGLQAGMASYVDTLRNLMVKSGGSNANLDQAFATLKLVIPFFIATGWLITIVVNGILAQRMLELRGLNRRPRSDLRTTALPPWLAGVMVAATVAALLGSGWLGTLGTNIALILCIPYFFVGLAVLHTVSAPWSGKSAILITAYLFLLFISWTAVLVTSVGFLEHWTGLRKRFGGPSPRNERKE